MFSIHGCSLLSKESFKYERMDQKLWDMSEWQPNDNPSFSNTNNISALYIHGFVKAHVNLCVCK